MLHNFQVQKSGNKRSDSVLKRKNKEIIEGSVKRIARSIPVVAPPPNQSITNIAKSNASTHDVAPPNNLFKYIYEIDCERVADNVQVSELVSLLI